MQTWRKIVGAANVKGRYPVIERDRFTLHSRAPGTWPWAGPQLRGRFWREAGQLRNAGKQRISQTHTAWLISSLNGLPPSRKVTKALGSHNRSCSPFSRLKHKSKQSLQLSDIAIANTKLFHYYIQADKTHGQISKYV